MLTSSSFIATGLLTLLAASPILAVPSADPQPEKTVAKRNGPGVYICTESNWSGACYWEESANGYCHEYWLGPNTSFGPDRGISCTIHPQSNCQGDSYVASYPGTGQLDFTGLSWKCEVPPLSITGL
jgi:hypothetical protein